MKKQIGMVGLGKMGANAARNLINKDWDVYGYNRTAATTKELEKEGLKGVYDLKEFSDKLQTPRVIFLLVPAVGAADEVIQALIPHLSTGDFIIDAGNSHFKETLRRAKEIESTGKGISFFDVGFSGGPQGALTGGCLMIGGKREWYDYLKKLFVDLAKKDGEMFFEGVGAGHFTKMVHNGIEYGMMQALGEGFEVLHKSPFSLNLLDVCRIYNNGSVIESRLTQWLQNGYEKHGKDLEDVSGAVGQGGGGAGQVGNKGEAVWTVETANEMGVPAKVIDDSVKAREISREKPSYQSKVVNVIRNEFGGHSIK